MILDLFSTNEGRSFKAQLGTHELCDRLLTGENDFKKMYLENLYTRVKQRLLKGKDMNLAPLGTFKLRDYIVEFS